MNPVYRWFINQGMRSGIADKTARSVTITLYLDKSEFKKALQIDSEETITVLLLDTEHSIIWRTTGRLSETAERQLRKRVSKFFEDET